MPISIVQAVTLPQTPSPPSTVAPTSSVVPTLPPSSYLPPFPTVAPSAAPTAAPTTAPTPAVIIEPIRPVTIPAFIAPATSPPQFIAPATTAPIIIEPIRPVTIPAFIAPATSAPPTAAPSFVAPVTAPPAFIAPATTAPASIAPLLPVATQSPISFPPRPTVVPLIDASSSNMALMPQLPQVQMAQIVKLDVDCAKESMVVKIKFDRPFGGLIYSKVFPSSFSSCQLLFSIIINSILVILKKKGFHGNLDCHYVRFGTNRDSYEFIVRLNSCGSQWVDQLATGGKAYLENVIIIQNEPGIQEVRLNPYEIESSNNNRWNYFWLTRKDLGYFSIHSLLLGRKSWKDGHLCFQHWHAGHSDRQFQRRFGHGQHGHPDWQGTVRTKCERSC